MRLTQRIRGLALTRTSTVSIVALLLVGHASLSAAEDLDPSSACTGETTMSQIECLQGVLGELNDELNSVYRQYRSTLDADGSAQIKGIQIAWMKYRDGSCRFESSAVEGGSLQPVMSLLCQISYTQERLARIEGMLRCDSIGTPGGECSR